MSLLMKNVGTKYAFGFDNLHLEIKKKFPCAMSFTAIFIVFTL